MMPETGNNSSFYKFKNMGIMMVKIYAPNFHTLNLDETVVAFFLYSSAFTSNLRRNFTKLVPSLGVETILETLELAISFIPKIRPLVWCTNGTERPATPLGPML